MSDTIPSIFLYSVYGIGAVILAVLIARLVFRSYFAEKQKYLKRSLGLVALSDTKEKQQ